MARYAPSNVPTSPELDQTQRWLREETEQIRNSTDDIYTIAQFVIDNYAVAGYGGILNEGPAAFDVGLAYQTVPFVEELLAEPRGVEQRFTSNALVFEAHSVWSINFRFNLAGHDSSNAGRVVYFRFYNATKAIASNPISIGIGRNVEDTYFNITTIVEIPETDIGDEYTLELGGGDAVIGGDLAGVEFSASNVSEFKGTLGQLIGTRSEPIAALRAMQQVFGNG